MHRDLTEKFCQAVKLPKDAVQLNVFDSCYPALCLRVGRHSKAWTFHFRKDCKQHRVVLGKYPDMSLAEAREAWRKAREGLPIARPSWGAVAPASPSFDSVIAEWFQSWKVGLAENSVVAVESQLRTHILPALGTRNLADISKRDAMALLDNVKQRAPSQAIQVYGTLKKFFEWCCKRDILAVNPLATIDKKDIGTPGERDRVLSDDELVKLVRYVRGSNVFDPYRTATFLLILTGARRDMIGSMRWEDVNGETIAFPGERMKNGEAFELPLTPRIRAVLDSIPRIVGCPFVFGHRLTHWSKSKPKIDKATGVKDWQLRDIRRTVSTGMQRLGIAPDVIDAVQAHTMTGIKRVYQRHHYRAEKLRALEVWGEFVNKLA
jgi:integrase